MLHLALRLLLTVLAISACGAAHERDERPDAGPPPLDCDEGWREIEDELAALRACTDNAQCGQNLGLSCGCTRDVIARWDADRTRFDDLFAAYPPSCGRGFSGPCDCPEAQGYACIEGQCDWCYTADLSRCADSSRSPRCYEPQPVCDTCGLGGYYPMTATIDDAGEVVAVEDRWLEPSRPVEVPPWSPDVAACVVAALADRCYPRRAGMRVDITTGSCTL